MPRWQADQVKETCRACSEARERAQQQVVCNTKKHPCWHLPARVAAGKAWRHGDAASDVRQEWTVWRGGYSSTHRHVANPKARWVRGSIIRGCTAEDRQRTLSCVMRASKHARMLKKRKLDQMTQGCVIWQFKEPAYDLSAIHSTCPAPFLVGMRLLMHQGRLPPQLHDARLGSQRRTRSNGRVNFKNLAFERRPRSLLDSRIRTPRRSLRCA